MCDCWSLKNKNYDIISRQWVHICLWLTLRYYLILVLDRRPLLAGQRVLDGVRLEINRTTGARPPLSGLTARRLLFVSLAGRYENVSFGKFEQNASIQLVFECFN